MTIQMVKAKIAKSPIQLNHVFILNNRYIKWNYDNVEQNIDNVLFLISNHHQILINERK